MANAAFTLIGFDDQERNLKFLKTAFQVLKLKILACNMKHGRRQRGKSGHAPLPPGFSNMVQI